MHRALLTKNERWPHLKPRYNCAISYSEVSYSSNVTAPLIKINIAEPLSNIVNLSFGNALYFYNLKISKLIPVYKDKGTLLHCSNYCPISLLSNINKKFEKLMYQRQFTHSLSHIIVFIFINLVLEEIIQQFMLLLV